ncbi:MAG: hypothetical protein KME26_24600 [Oscillatoria princeps RMCB-10]|nr:hypothetical protein [Oscillatoria princeps RMCB-10]
MIYQGTDKEKRPPLLNAGRATVLLRQSRRCDVAQASRLSLQSKIGVPIWCNLSANVLY